ncbi:hypothetical protein K456DRAFT_1556531 [Colletotrichum gloeosporioides 23]|nr:hypothetical protein K456DRAFT_1556531 [Colletotrichum gloeosporioides 23]
MRRRPALFFLRPESPSLAWESHCFVFCFRFVSNYRSLPHLTFSLVVACPPTPSCCHRYPSRPWPSASLFSCHFQFPLNDPSTTQKQSQDQDIHPYVLNYVRINTWNLEFYSRPPARPCLSSQPLILRASASHFAVRDLCGTDPPWRPAHSPPPFQLSHSSPFGASVPDPSLCQSPSVALPLFLSPLHQIDDHDPYGR